MNTYMCSIHIHAHLCVDKYINDLNHQYCYYYALYGTYRPMQDILVSLISIKYYLGQKAIISTS